jgi:serine/threonine protein kinase
LRAPGGLVPWNGVSPVSTLPSADPSTGSNADVVWDDGVPGLADGTDVPADGDASARLRGIEAALPVPGHVDGDLRFESFIAASGRAVVYRAFHLRLGVQVAVKVLRPALLAGHRDIIEMLCEDAYRATGIAHRNVARIHGVVSGSRGTYVTTDLVDGVDLAAMLRRRRQLPPRMVVRIVRDVAAGLSAGAERGLNHGDLKPSNIVLAASGRTRVLDLGLRALTWIGGHDAMRLTYAAPEVIDLGGPGDHRSDLYALGVIAYQALTGSQPFPSDDSEHALAQKRAGHALSPSLFVPGLDPRIDDLLDWMMSPDPDRRPRTCAHVVRVCRELDSST